MRTRIYYYNLESILAVKKDITIEEEFFTEDYLENLTVEVDEDSELFSFTQNTLYCLIVHIIRHYNEIVKMQS